MKSQVSFKFEGETSHLYIVALLKANLEGLKYKIEPVNKFTFRIYVGSIKSDVETMRICRLIQSNAVYDFNREL